MAGVEHLDMGEDIGDRQSAFANTAVEVLLVALVGFSFVETHNVFVGVLAVVPFFLDGCARDLATVDEDPPFRALEGDTVFPATFHNHFDTAGEFAADREVMRGVVTVVARCETIFIGNGVFGIRAIDFNWAHARFMFAERPGGDVDVVRSPVGELATGILVPPAELVVAAFLPVVDQGGLALPEVPVEFLGRGCCRERPTGRTAVDPHGHFLDIAQKSFLDHVHGAQPTAAVTTLLGANEENFVAVLFAGVANQLVFFERQRQWFLTENVLAGFQGFNGDLDVPMVGSDDTDDVDVVAFEYSAVVLVGVCFAVADFAVDTGTLGVSLVDITDRYDISKPTMRPGVSSSHATDTDAANLGAIVGSQVGEGRGG